MNLITSCYPSPLIGDFDELEFIQHAITNQRQTTETLQNNVQKMVSALRHQEILSLQAQISPHYISNLLDNINWIAVQKYNGPNEISYCAEKTAALFRYGMNLSSSFDTLENEIEIAKSTLDVLNIRYQLNVDLSCHIQADAENLKLVKVLLQPFIENAIVHGFANYKQKGTVNLSVSVKEDTVRIEITDDGKGMSEAEIDKLKLQINDFSYMRVSNIGLWNISYRLNLLFADKSSINIESEIDKYTTFTIEFPIINY